MRKTYQRKFNKLVRQLNKNIAQDELWKGRFVFRQKNAFFEKFDDNSGGILHVILRGVDKKTGFYQDTYIDYAPYFHFNKYHLWEFANRFIVEGSEVWNEKPAPSLKNAEDFTQTSIDEKIWRKPENWTLSYSAWKEA